MVFLSPAVGKKSVGSEAPLSPVRICPQIDLVNNMSVGVMPDA